MKSSGLVACLLAAVVSLAGVHAGAQTYDVLKTFPVAASPSGLVKGSDGAFYGTTLGGGALNFGMVFRISVDRTTFSVLHNFDGKDGALPGGLVQGSDGALYGTTQLGGASGYGTVFKVSPDGSLFALIHSFDRTNGSDPICTLVAGTDGAFYGTTRAGGAFAAGTVFKVSPDGSSFAVIHSFDGASSASPYAGLAQGSDGAFYGTTREGGASAVGTVFRVSADGSSFAVIHSFDGTNGEFPYGRVVPGPDGALYGTTSDGGAFNFGTVFKVSADGTTFSVIHSFDETNGSLPISGLVAGSDGVFYGTTSGGGQAGVGTVFKVSADGSMFSVTHSFAGADSNAGLLSGFVQGSDGAFYGTTSDGTGNGTVFKLSADGTTFIVFHRFDDLDGILPTAGLVEGSDGAFYGTTQLGGASDVGTVFKVSADGSAFTAIHSFVDFTDGSHPVPGLVKGSDGALYGTTSLGGGTGPLFVGWGTVFRISEDGAFSVIHLFDFGDGINPTTGLVKGSDGAFYGTTPSGGGGLSFGTVFRLSADGTMLSVLHDFDTASGFHPAGLVEGSDGALYGTTYWGGASGYGTVFRVTADGATYSVIHSFDPAGPANPNAGLVQGSDGALYGTTYNGGAYGFGTVFRISADGTVFSVIHSFDSTNGAHPAAALVQGSDGAFYGTTVDGGLAGGGTAFKVTADGTTFFVIHDFDFVGGANPSALVQGSDGAFYGTTSSGGLGGGVVFRLEGPFEPTISIGDVAVLEGNAGTTNAAFAVTLSQVSARTVTVDYATADGTATAAGHDYVPISGTLTFSPGETRGTIVVPVRGDTANETLEVFFLNLSHPTNATLARAHGVGAILNDDPRPRIFITNPAPVTEGSSTKTVTFLVGLTRASVRTVTVDYATADDTATAPSDYLAKSGTLTFPPGATLRAVTVTIEGDLIREPTEDFFLNLTNAVNAVLLSPQGVATILDDDP